MAVKHVLVALCILHTAQCANILVMTLCVSHSIHLWFSHYLQALSDRGHNITYLNLDPYKNPPKNVRHIMIEGTYESIEIDTDSISSSGAFDSVRLLSEWDDDTSAHIRQSKGFAKFKEIITNEKFDLVVDDFTSTAFMMGVVDKLGNPPLMGMTPFAVPDWALGIAGSPLPYVDAPHFLLAYHSPMTTFQRMKSTLLYLYSLYDRYWYIRKQDVHSKLAFGPNTPHINDIIDRVNIVLVNANPATTYPFATMPGVIGIGGLHIKPSKPLPKDLQDYLDEASDGVIYFSLGSNVQSSMLQPERIDILKEAFRQLAPVKVLWKWETDELHGKPDNVRVAKWMPQNDILAHPNVRLFFTHSGLLSTQEATYHGVPLVGMPFFLDQHVNIKKCEALGIAKKLAFETLSVDSVKDTLRTVLEDPSYAANMSRLSTIFRDSVVPPMDQAVYWTEYAIRHKGASHLRPASKDLAWPQTLLLDLLAILLVPIVLLYLVLTRIRSYISTLKTRKPKKSKTN